MSSTSRAGEPREIAASTWPFAVLLVLAAISVIAPLDASRLIEVSAALVAVGVLGALQVGVVARRCPRWVALSPALGCFLVVALLRDASGGARSGLSALVLAPALYLALVGGQRILWLSVALTGLTVLIPVLVVGGPRYGPEEWRRALVWMAIVALVGSLVQTLMRRLHDETDQVRRSESRLQMVLDGAQLSSMIVTDADGLITTFSVGAENLLGHRAADVMGRLGIVELHHADEIRAVARELSVEPGLEVFARLAAARSESRIWTWTRADADVIHVQSAITELKDDELLVGYLIVSINVTEAIRSRTALQDAEQRWRVTMDHLPDTTLIVTDENLTVTLVSGAGSMREKVEQKSGYPLAEVVSPDNVAVLTELSTLALAGQSGSVDLNSARTGHEHQVTVVPVLHVSGSSEALILARDVSQDRARQRALEEAKHRAERIFADAPVAILVHGLDGIVQSANPAALRLVEATADVVVGSSVFSLLPESEVERAAAWLTRLQQLDGQVVELRWEYALPDGRMKFLSMTSRILPDDAGLSTTVLAYLVDRTDQHLYEEQLVHLADHDPLTGLANRRRFDAELERHLQTCRRYGAEGAVLMLDLDHFKQVNDTVGHPVGDLLLREVAGLLTEDLRASDTVARLGGDEFAVLLPRVSRDDVDVVASSLVRSLRRAMQRQEGPMQDVTVSVGVAMVEDSDLTALQMMSLADLTLYVAKQRGRDQHVVYDVAMGSVPTSVPREWGVTATAYGARREE